jgi:hypothetical protein
MRAMASFLSLFVDCLSQAGVLGMRRQPLLKNDPHNGSHHEPRPQEHD